MIKLDKKSILLVLASVLLSSVILSMQFMIPATGKVSDNSMIQGAVHAASLGDIETVSVAHDPNIKSYPNKSESPYGPDVNPTYNLVEQALIYLNPDNPDNPLSNIIQQGDTVVLKPNLVGKSEFAKEGCTRTPILRPLVDFAVQAGASKVIIAEGSAYPYPDSIVFGPDFSNITGLVQALQSMYPGVAITYKDLNLDDFTWVDLGENSTFYGIYTPQQLYSVFRMRMDENSYYYAPDCNGYNPKGYRPGLYAIANTVFKADVFINVPKMKVHWLTGVTLSLKNLIGITVSSTGNTTHEESIKDVPHWNNSGPTLDELLPRQDSFANDVVWRVMADLNKIVLYAGENGLLKPVKQRRYLSVVDAIVGMEGPTVYNPPGVPRPTGAIIAGQNPVAVDAVCTRVMGFNYTVLNSVVNMEQISDHPIGKADPTAICVVGASLDNTTFGEPYVPHQNYEDPRIAPYKIRLQYFGPPEAELIKTYPETPREDVETKVILYTQNIDLVAAGWLRYSIDSAEHMIIKMVSNGENMIGNLGLLEGGTRVSYDVCLQNFFFNTGWSDKISIFVGSGDNTPPTISILSPENKTYASNNVPLIFAVDEPTHWIGYSVDGEENATISGNTTITDVSEGSHNLKVYANDTFNNMGLSDTVYFTTDTLSPKIEILSPENMTYKTNSVSLSFTVDEVTSWMGCSLDGQMNVAISGNTTLVGLSDGLHTIKLYANDTAGNLGHSNTVYFTIDTTPPSISIVSPGNKTYDVTDIQLTFTVDESVVWMAYSLDGQANVTITGNSTLSGLSNGTHQVIIYVKDTAGNTGSSGPVHFTVETEREEAFPIEIALAMVVVVAVVACILVTVYLKRARITPAENRSWRRRNV